MTKEELQKKINDITSIVEEIDTVLRAKVNEDVEEYEFKTEIDERRVRTASMGDLVKLKKEYQRELNQLQKRLDLLNGTKHPRTIVPRFRD